MSHQLSECPNCRRAFLGGVDRSGSGTGRCRVCGTSLVPAAGEKESEVHDRLYGRRLSPTTVTGVSSAREGPSR